VLKPEKCTKQGMHVLIYYEDVDQLRPSDLRVMRTGPVCCEPRHRQMEASSAGLCPCWRRAFWTLLM